MKRLVWFCVIAFSSFSGFAVAASPTLKPASPLSISIQADGAVVPGTQARFTVRAVSHINVDSLLVTVRPPARFTLNEGALSWRGPVKAGVPVELVFSGTLAAVPYQVLTATARVHGTPRASFAARAVFPVGTEPNRRILDHGRSVWDGRSVIEIPLPDPKR